MILIFENTITKTSFGNLILQVDSDLIVSVQPQDFFKSEVQSNLKFLYSPIPNPGGIEENIGLFSDIMIPSLVIELEENIRVVHFSDYFSRDNSIRLIFDEMLKPEVNKFYRKNI